MSRVLGPIRIGIVLLPLLAVGAVAGPAEASSWGYASAGATHVEFEADYRVANKVVITRSGRTVIIDDRVRIKPGKGCKQAAGDKTKVRCTTKKVPTTVDAYVRDRNDSVINKSDLRLVAAGGAGADTLVGGPKADKLYGDRWGKAGNDKIYGGDGNDYIDAGDGADFVSGGNGDDSINGDTNVVTEPGRPGNDVVHGGNGDDDLWGYGGDDRLFGGNGDDGLRGGDGRDALDGGAGNDVLIGDLNPARLAADVMRGGAGVDEVRYSHYTRAVTVDLDGESGDDGAPGEHDTVGADTEILVGTSGDDTLTGNAEPNEIDGYGGNDAIIGGAGNDYLLGSDGNDSFWGSEGNDTIETRGGVNRADGGPDSDVCVSRVLEDALISCEVHRPW
ncbi:calcium-binding protein [Actinoplanes sp. NEAU-A12]|uniref:Calcium-binding protein n=1 Tax=Actinoplanes sandaracinus TaxID=3045177 RepID=A0ABT6X1L7_9ACTN|nr:calcium-binding protein [Actinoplanes sandaracinus]MDI6105898.1 calcium-binding protein [Actinoplanes sandaracinus]